MPFHLSRTPDLGHRYASRDLLWDRQLRFLRLLPAQNGAGVPLAVQDADDGYQLGTRQLVDAELVKPFDMP